jgi:membrane protein YqaA with SNARE-associated domain
MTTTPHSPSPPAATGDLAALVEQASGRVRSRLRTAVFVAENAVVLALIVWWFAVGHGGHVHGLLVLFLYCFPSEFLIAPVPHEPVLIYFGKLYAPWVVALVSVLGTLLVEALNYHAFGFVADARPLRRVVRSPIIGRLVRLFGRWPFATLIIGALAPVPFYPLRFVVVLARYPIGRYLAAVAIARLPRFYLMALLGAATHLPDGIFVAVFLLCLGVGVVPLVPWSRLRGHPQRASGANTAPLASVAPAICAAAAPHDSGTGTTLANEAP